MENRKAKDYEYDNCAEIWELYKKIYTEQLSKNGKGYFLSDINMNKNKIFVSGDIVFNFNGNKCGYYKSLLEADSICSCKKKDILTNMLEQCSNLHHSPQNVSIMLKTGGLNNIKQGIANDRFDAFISEIHQFYMGNKFYILENGNFEKMDIRNRIELEKNLESFGEGQEGFEKFLWFFYHIESDGKLAEKLLASGKKRMVKCDDLYDYLCLAFEYWINIAKFYCNCNNEKIKEDYLKLDNACAPGEITEIYTGFISSWLLAE